MTFFRSGLLAASIIALSSGSALADYELNILHINDLHSRIEAINKFDSTCSAEEEGKGECFGGVARLKTAIDTQRQALTGKNVLLLNAGDNFQGSLFYTTYKGAVEAEFLNLMKFDAMTVGNHEFDDSEDGLATFLDKVQFPVVTANVAASASSKIGDRIKPFIVLDQGGQKIGIVGAVANDTAELSSPGPNVLIGDDVADITAAIGELKKQGVNKIIALTHVGYPRDLAAIAKIPDVDVVVGGHTNTFLSNTSDKAEGPYPTLVDNPGGYKVPVVQAAAYSKYLGNLKVVFDDAGVVKESSGEPVLIDGSIKPDEAVLARIKELGGPIEELKNKIVAESAAPIDGSREVCRAAECAMGNLVADAILDRTKSQGMTIAITNGGGLRASIDGGPVSMGEVLSVLPFQNTVATFQLKGSDLVAALENGLGQIEEGAGRFPQVSGMKYSFDKSKPAGSRVVSVEVKEGEAFVPLDPAKTYGIVSNNYMRAGGDGYSVFAKAGQNAYDFGPNLELVVADYLAAHRPYQPYTDGRITEVANATVVETPASTETATGTEAKPAAGETATKSAEGTATSGEAASGTTTTTAETATVAAGGKHVIARGDTLWDLAKAAYGDGTLWRKIAEANGNPRPRALHVGTELSIPTK
ncbi:MULTISPECIES: 5'-nucleotidase C-terminal domain-containing protein [unclassified Shinella]|uniref:5'-nucleotidase C-terminal domain-containing protein n=1 Tax=unclassified Shinella TaxID=2643062 RepID=UPI00102D4B1F|nr:MULTISPECIES: 5'-nucleotidase C-terminal domain-containing protein [unclassified Shinella]MCO5150703.1 5'-nucleotidase C-terminal domain-containing protein [Shinella sp.]MDC7263286.1 5'-nucleotidase C-terminal domain-containing protein [Shinella sp. HY16]MDC7270181.1 5'-nucleotidase C-terminal domain-containing protein [Shinella sp. YZ44]TAA64904.1 LysM peptidoglycan-binding domain-containing protein [Shinella sp. JR1-6]